jgi:NADPH-dependent 2,4-dienoyl-CoA reductase/sulfur reductase-like enzyme
VAGFYYKTFMWPKKFWEAIYEPIIRKAAGLGHLEPRGRSGPLREGLHAHCDVLVVGSGPAGLMAALTAAQDRGTGGAWPTSTHGSAARC